ncbi:XdhC family protein [Micromonospora zamorensis]|uniref:XdhC family protein n=1 Tax=Micromonospora zamorensis TaxID=709883 RepID=UPI00081FE5F5|nr:XdhC family protein [Micromonospora zamorensis]WTI22755.1 XdhC family protein [Micromonospora zamorensis]SCG54481.1 xanthine dehydrogenase accessory factor [Micromonospora zamorensis]
MTTIAERARELTDTREPFVHATVVRAQDPTSARPGDAAVIRSDGSIEGFVGGVCAESSVRAAALDTLRDGTALLLRVLPEGAVPFPDTPGARVVVNPCHSGGAIEVFLRPMLPAPALRVVGSTPISAAVANLAAFLDFDVVAADDCAGCTAVVVAGLGKGEQEAIRAALDAGVGFIALVASGRRGAALLDELGLTDEERARVHSPAGVDIGARTPAEIALSIMAEVVRAIRVDGLTPASGAPAARPQQAVDPVCGMTVLVGPETPHARVDGQDFWFCCAGCLASYTAA